MAEDPSLEVLIAQWASQGREEYRERYGQNLFEDRYQINDHQAELLLRGEGAFEATITPDMMRHLFFFNQQLHDGLSSLIMILGATARHDQKAAAENSGIMLAAFSSSDNHFRAFIGELLNRAEKVAE